MKLTHNDGRRLPFLSTNLRKTKLRKTKLFQELSIVATTALLTFSAASTAVSGPASATRDDLTLSHPVAKSRGSVAPGDSTKPTDIYLIQLSEPAAAQYQGGISNFAPLSNRSTGATKLDVTANNTRQYVNYLQSRQNKVLSALGKSSQRSASDVLYHYHYAVNGMSVKMTAAQARQARALPGVKQVLRDYRSMPSTDTGPGFIGAPTIWDGSASSFPAEGEGVVIGILDTGINHGHPSFAEIGEDGYGALGEYGATNPFGDGNFAGGPGDECSDPGFVGLCNNKLIGSYAFLAAHPGGTDPVTPPGDPISKDTDGHGSHVASTAGGNRLLMPPLPDADGNDTGLSLGMVSGVAPHAHIIAYKVCANGCFSSDIVAAVDQAIFDGVDALNQSISAAAGSPWNDMKALAFLVARDAGIMVQNSSGNSGPGAATAAHTNGAPWATSVGASTHDRAFPEKQIGDFSGGILPVPMDLFGRGVTDGFSGDLVFAGDFPVGSPGDANFDTPEQCLEPFPPGTFSADQIVVCDRGAIARVQKGRNVRDGGAGAFVLANIDGGATSVADDPHVIPAIHIKAEYGNILKSWLASGTGHMGTITGTGPAFNDPAQGDIMADFSSRGPYSGFDMLTPDVTAPGVSIFAAGAGLQFEHPGFATADPDDDPSVAAEFGIIGGTSMSSPHATGSAALLRQLHPDWTPAQVKSALMTTGETDLLKEDGVTPADPFDFGGGRVNLEDAAQVGLLMDETTINFILADPASGGDPKDLNVPGLVDETCAPTCQWSRTLTNATDETVNWNSNWIGSPGMVIDIMPPTFSLNPGESQEVMIYADVSGAIPNQWNFGEVQFDALGNGLPQQHLPVAALFSTATNPQFFSKSVDKAQASAGQILTYELDITNLGDQGDFTVNDPLPDGVNFVESSLNEVVDGGVTTSPLSYDAETNTVSWSGNLGPQSFDLSASPSPFGYFSLGDFGVAPFGCPSNCDDGGVIVSGIDFTYLNNHYTEVIWSVNGTLELGKASLSAAGPGNALQPDPTPPNNLLAPFWTDLNLGAGGEWYVAVLSAGSFDFLVFSWENVPLFGNPTAFSFQIWHEMGTSNTWYTYGQIPAVPGSLSVGFEDDSGTSGDSYYFNGEGTAPAAGTDLLVQAIPGGSAHLSFQAEVDGAVGETIINQAEAVNGVVETALAVTQIIELDTDNDGVPDNQDNCITEPNPNQCNSDQDPYGNHCDADFDNNGFVNYFDMGTLFRANGSPSSPPDFHEGDLDCDGTVGVGDFNLFRGLFNKPPGPSGIEEK